MTFFSNTPVLRDMLKMMNIPLRQSFPSVELIVQTYLEPDQGRLDEFVACLLGNLNNRHVSHVFNLCEGPTDSYLPQEVRGHSKYRCYPGHGRLTFEQAFTFANNNLVGRIIGLMNLDILLAEDFDIHLLHNMLQKKSKTVFATSRHEMNPITRRIYLDNNFKRLFHAHTQDAWFFQSPVTVVNANFALGLVGCDNAIAHRFWTSGYTLYNMPRRFKIIHVDRWRGKTSRNFSTFHQTREKIGQVANTHPETTGQLLVPDYDAVKDLRLDHLIQCLGYTEEEKVWLVANILGNKIKIYN